jgi:two-component system, NtrC family, sensor kinase
MTSPANRRILLVDDMPTIHEDFRKILAPPSATQSALKAASAALFGDDDEPAEAQPAEPFEIDSVYQGEEGLAKVEAALAKGLPYAMAFVDMRMPPGWDGVETIERLWRVDPRLQVVICTAYSDTSWEEVLKRLDTRDRLLILKKPFDNIEVRQLANALTAKWQMTRELAGHIDTLEATVQERTASLRAANEQLQREIAERKQWQAQLVQQGKLASIGQLAAGVAHEINNPIGFIFSNFGALERYLGDLFRMLAACEEAGLAPTLRSLHEALQIDFIKEDVPGLIRDSKDGIHRVRQIVQDLKDFSRVDSSHEWQPARLNEGIASTLNVVASEVRYKADVVKELAELPEVECLPCQINQVVLNLVVNAAQAMGEERGCITVRSGSDGHGEVWFEVADNGCGIPQDVLPRIFDPFFTTKPVGVGTGLGLALSYGIVEKHHGRMSVDSEVGRGTTFRVTLPCRQAATVAAAAAAAAEPVLA